MKLKYYLRGLGIGIIVTTIILTISFSGKKAVLSDEDVIKRAEQLGMVMSESEHVQTEMVESEATESVLTEIQEAETQEAGTQEIETEETGTEKTPTEETVVQGDQSQSATDSQTVEEGYKELVIGKGEYCRAISEKLVSLGIIDDSEAFQKYMYETKEDGNICQGTYQIPVNATFEEISKIITEMPQTAE